MSRTTDAFSFRRGLGPILLLPPIAWLLIPDDWPRWAWMWTLAFAIYVGCKWLTWRRTPTKSVGTGKQIAYLLFWPGLDAAAFMNGKVKRPPAGIEWLFATAKMTLGLTLLLSAPFIIPPSREFLLGWTGMVGLVFALHFGLFHLLSCLWRSLGVDAKPLMNWPIASRSVSEFWGLRWNTAFRDFAHRYLFRPLTRRLGPRRAVAAGFLFSGVVHDAVISLPAGGGYGGPTLYFMIQGLALLIERSPFGQHVRLGRGTTGRLFTLATVAGPVWLLFHPTFVIRIMAPFTAAIGAA